MHCVAKDTYCFAQVFEYCTCYSTWSFPAHVSSTSLTRQMMWQTTIDGSTWVILRERQRGIERMRFRLLVVTLIVMQGSTLYFNLWQTCSRVPFAFSLLSVTFCPLAPPRPNLTSLLLAMAGPRRGLLEADRRIVSSQHLPRSACLVDK